LADLNPHGPFGIDEGIRPTLPQTIHGGEARVPQIA